LVRPAICLDIDNVIGATDSVMRGVIRDHSTTQVDLSYEDVVCFDYWLCRDRAGRRITREEWGIIHEAFTHHYLPRIVPYEGVKAHLERLIDRLEIHLATSRLKDGWSETIDWLSRHQIPYTELHFVNHGEKHLIDHPFLAAVEDDREQAYAFYSKGIEVFLLAHPWNIIGPCSPLNRVAGWPELTRKILSLKLL